MSPASPNEIPCSRLRQEVFIAEIHAFRKISNSFFLGAIVLSSLSNKLSVVITHSSSSMSKSDQSIIIMIISCFKTQRIRHPFPDCICRDDIDVFDEEANPALVNPAKEPVSGSPVEDLVSSEWDGRSLNEDQSTILDSGEMSYKSSSGSIS